MAFTERITRILQCLSTQKTICKHLLDPLYMHQFVDDPVSAYKRVIANKTLNKRKGEVMNAGKQVLGAKKTSAATTNSQEVQREEANRGVTMTPANTPGSVPVNGRSIFATPTAPMRQTSTNVTPQAANRILPVATGPGAHSQLGHVQVPPALARLATTRAYTNSMMGPTSHPRQSVGFNPLTPNSQPPSHVKPLDTLYNPEAVLGNLIQRNMANPNANPNANPIMNPNMKPNMTPSMTPSMNPNLKSRMNPGVNPNSNTKMTHTSLKNPNAQVRQQQQLSGATTGTRKRTLSDTDFEDQGLSVKRQH